jgi:hypothetical protein
MLSLALQQRGAKAAPQLAMPNLKLGNLPKGKEEAGLSI